MVSRSCVRGFTLLELLVVLMIIAMGTVGVTLTLPDPAESALDREAVRLAALLESARAQSRASGVPVTWFATPDGFAFRGLAKEALPDHWSERAVWAETNSPIILGPEPILEPRVVVLRHSGLPNGRRIMTDGLQPFRVADVSE